MSRWSPRQVRLDDHDEQMRRHHGEPDQRHVDDERDQPPHEAGVWWSASYRRPAPNQAQREHGQREPDQRAGRVPQEIVHVEQTVGAREHAHEAGQLHRLQKQRRGERQYCGNRQRPTPDTAHDEAQRQEEHDIKRDLQYGGETIGTDVTDELQWVDLRCQMVRGAIGRRIGRHRIQCEAQQAEQIQHRAIRHYGRRQSDAIVAVIQQRQHRHRQQHGHKRPQCQRERKRFGKVLKKSHLQCSLLRPAPFGFGP